MTDEALRVRYKAADCVMRIKSGAYSNLVLDSLRTGESFSSRDMGFITALVYGTLEKLVQLDSVISLYIGKRQLSSVDVELLAVLETASYQLLFSDIPRTGQIINESVEVCRLFRKTSAKGFVNAVLRKISSDRAVILCDLADSDELFLKYSLDNSIVWCIMHDYPDRAEDILRGFEGRKPVYIRANTVRYSIDEIKGLLEKSGIEYELSDIEGCILIADGSAPLLSGLPLGSFRVQSYAAQCASDALDVRPGMAVLDSCSAPGGKALTCAMQMNDTGRIIAVDRYKSRTSLIDKACSEEGISIIETRVCDMTAGAEFDCMFDRVLCDVPCSGLGEISGKPEIRMHCAEDYSDLPEIQYKILKNSAQHLKRGGKLVYSTCTILKRENEDVVRRFLNDHSDFALRDLKDYSFSEPCSEGRVFLPGELNSEGFYIASFVRL